MLNIFLKQFLILSLFICCSQLSFAKNTITFDPDLPIFLGSGIDHRFVPLPKNTCINFTEQFETDGAQETKVSFQLIDSYKKLEKELDFSFSYSMVNKASWSSYKAGGSFDISSEYESFIKNEEKTLYIMFKAFSEYGRNIATNYELKPEYKQLIDKREFAAFISQCGTHTVLAERRVGSAYVLIEITGLTKDTKEIIKGSFNSTSNFSGGGNEFSAELNSETKAEWSSAITFASNFGKINATIYSSGGEGIKQVTNITEALVKDSQFILSSLAEYVKAFTQQNSSISNFVLLENKAFGLESPNINFDNYDILKENIENLLSIDLSIEQVKRIEHLQPDIYAKYFKTQAIFLEALRTKFISSIDDCFYQNLCSLVVLPDLEIFYLNDFLFDDRVVANCNYIKSEIANPDNIEGKLILEHITLQLTGKVRMAKSLQLLNSKVFEITPSAPIVANSFDSLRQRYPEREVTEVFGTIGHYQILDPNNENILNQELLQTLRQKKHKIEDKAFIIETKLANGASLQDFLGHAYFSYCPLTK